jgi:large subunit ribosomal protein L22
MEDENKIKDIENKTNDESSKDAAKVQSQDNKVDSKKISEKETKKLPEKTEKKESAMVRGTDLGISTKHSIDICNMIRGKSIENALKMLDDVLHYKKVVKMNKREVGHKHGKGIMAGRYPQKACAEFVRLLKQLNFNAIVNEVEPTECVIFCKADVASRPYRRQGHRFKRTHVLLKLEKIKIKKSKKGGKKK